MSAAVAAFVAILSMSGSDERENMMDELRASVCLFCGSLDPACECWCATETETPS